MRPLSLAALVSVVFLSTARAADDGWIDLSSGPKALEAWAAPTGDWFLADSVEVSPQNPKLLVGKPGQGILVNGPTGRTNDILSKEKYADLETHFEFMIPKGSNSGVKFMGLYEVQIFDSHDAKKLTGSDCGGIYPRAELFPRYHHIDEGSPPKVNACKPAGEWQTLDVVFRAPRFAADGTRTASARFVKVVLNGTVIHEDEDVLYPTGHAWRLSREVARGPLLLQADHGPVAFRNIRIRPMEIAK
jgi:hypothetical protein